MAITATTPTPTIQPPLVSVLTALGPADVKFLPALLTSLLAQTFTAWEWHIIEDGPTSVGAPFVDRDPRIHWINLSRPSGPAHARNIGASISTGTWLRNLDADDSLPAPTTLADALAVTNNVGYIVGPVVEQVTDGMAWQPVHGASNDASPLVPAGPINPGTLLAHYQQHDYTHAVHPTTLMIRRDLFLALGGYGGLSSSEDAVLLLRASELTHGYNTAQHVRTLPHTNTLTTAH